MINKQRLIVSLKKFVWVGSMPREWVENLAEYLMRHEKDIVEVD